MKRFIATLFFFYFECTSAGGGELSGKDLNILTSNTHSIDDGVLSIESVQATSSHTYVVRLVNHGDKPVSATGIIVFLDATGAAILASGGRDEIGFVASQAPPGKSEQVHACLGEDTALPSIQDYDIGSYRCLAHGPPNLTAARSVVVVLLDVFVDVADRD